jgi:hypothetical protein
MKFHRLIDSMVVDMRTNINSITDDNIRKKLNFILQDYRNRIYKLEVDDATENVKKSI